MNILVTRFKLDNMFGCRFDSRVRFDNLVGCRLITSKVDPTNTLAGLQDQLPQLSARIPSRGLLCCPAATQASIPTDNTPEAASDSLPLEVHGWVRVTTKDLSELGLEVNATGIHIIYERATCGAIKFATISVQVPATRFRTDNWLGCSRVISKSTVALDDTFEAVLDPSINALEDQ